VRRLQDCSKASADRPRSVREVEAADEREAVEKAAKEFGQHASNLAGAAPVADSREAASGLVERPRPPVLEKGGRRSEPQGSEQRLEYWSSVTRGMFDRRPSASAS
jgi:hypothetical protein